MHRLTLMLFAVLTISILSFNTAAFAQELESRATIFRLHRSSIISLALHEAKDRIIALGTYSYTNITNATSIETGLIVLNMNRSLGIEKTYIYRYRFYEEHLPIVILGHKVLDRYAIVLMSEILALENVFGIAKIDLDTGKIVWFKSYVLPEPLMDFSYMDVYEDKLYIVFTTIELFSNAVYIGILKLNLSTGDVIEYERSKLYMDIYSKKTGEPVYEGLVSISTIMNGSILYVAVLGHGPLALFEECISPYFTVFLMAINYTSSEVLWVSNVINITHCVSLQPLKMAIVRDKIVVPLLWREEGMYRSILMVFNSSNGSLYRVYDLGLTSIRATQYLGVYCNNKTIIKFYESTHYLRSRIYVLDVNKGYVYLNISLESTSMTSVDDSLKLLSNGDLIVGGTYGVSDLVFSYIESKAMIRSGKIKIKPLSSISIDVGAVNKLKGLKLPVIDVQSDIDIITLHPKVERKCHKLEPIELYYEIEYLPLKPRTITMTKTLTETQTRSVTQTTTDVRLFLLKPEYMNIAVGGIIIGLAIGVGIGLAARRR